MNLHKINPDNPSEEEEDKNQVWDFGFFDITIEDIGPNRFDGPDVQPSKNSE